MWRGAEHPDFEVEVRVRIQHRAAKAQDQHRCQPPRSTQAHTYGHARSLVESALSHPRRLTLG
jgi:hypothetical protein